MQIMSRFPALFSGLFAAMTLFAACSPQLTPFTRDLYDRHHWSDAELKGIQFYLSDDLVIYRNVDEVDEVKISGGEIKMVDGRKVEEIRFRAGTPGVFISRPKEDHFAISFEEGDDTRYLMFGPNPKRDGQYMLMASEWNRRSGKVTYAGAKFQTVSDEIPRLLVSMKYRNQNSVEKRNASGRRVD